LVGNYSVLLNSTVSTGFFLIGLTNSTEYHRNELVDIRAVYRQSENVTLLIGGAGVRDSQNLTADSSGIVHYAGFTVPANASIGSYMVSISSISIQPTIKSVADVQNFTVPGFALNVTARNLAGDTVPSVEVRAFEDSTSVTNVTTTSDGLAILMLEVGNYTFQGFFKNQTVAELTIQVTNITAVDLVCNLTNLGIRVFGVVDGVEVGIPEVSVFLTPDNKSLTTDINGTVVAQSLLPNVTYVLNASRYGTSFNVTTIPSLIVNETVDITIVCPTLRLQVSAVNAAGQPLTGMTVKIHESVGGLSEEGSVDAEGNAGFNVVFGRYDVQVYDSNRVRLNRTMVNVFQDQNITVYCVLQGLSLSVTVVDYLGQPLSNVNVTLSGEGLGTAWQLTQGNGTATFNGIVGENYQVAVYLSGNSQPAAAQEVAVAGPTSVEIRLNELVSLAGFMVQTSQLAVLVIIVVTVVLILLLEVYRRTRSRPKETEGSTSNE
jgi:hypothetical protein